MFTELRAKAGYGPQVSAMESASVLSREVEDESEADEFPEPLPESVRNAIHEELLSWPSDEDASEIDSLAKNRGQDFMMGLWGMAVDALRSTEPDTIYGPGLQIDSDRDIIGSLISAGYAEQIPGTGVAVLTPQGRRIGRIFTAQGPPPDWVPEQVMAMRRAFEAVREMSRVTRDTRRQNSS
ncbi:hypothetical protein MINTM020_20970 [Mycobacterium paraintracellulare]|nr:hypothetical protein MINTM020_20970 [Mycobacterium paraintracellulare]